MNQTMKIARQDAAFSAASLRLDAEAEIERICAWIRETVLKDLRKRGVVLGLSGGIDSSVTAALCAQALGPSRVTGIFMPEHDSDPESLRLGQALAAATGVETVLEDIGPGPRRGGLLYPARRLHTADRAGIRRRLGLQGGAGECPLEPRLQYLLACRRVADWRAE
jgi:hypothetical protein